MGSVNKIVIIVLIKLKK